MASGIQPDAGQILNSLINSVLVVDDALAIHYANPAAQRFARAKLTQTVRDAVT